MKDLILRNDDTYWYVMNDGVEVAKFRLRKMPYCSAVCLFCDFVVHPDYRRRGIARYVVKEAIKIAWRNSYVRLLATVVDDNLAMRKCLSDWKLIDAFYNRNTGHNVVMYQLTNPLSTPVPIKRAKTIKEYFKSLGRHRIVKMETSEGSYFRVEKFGIFGWYLGEWYPKKFRTIEDCEKYIEKPIKAVIRYK